ncbi:hypothetical protein ABVK25_003535 [Lepraria finkii]|uniref:Uncharacterized protein n=1 Tax=Lepraria finkii TaxID=1340010 RepID=A0ABR4BEJ8_9LECA
MGKNKFVETEVLVEYSLTQAGTSSKVDRWQWLSKRVEAEKLLSQLNGLRNDLKAHMFGIQNSSVDLQQVSSFTKESWGRQQQFNDRMTDQLAQSEAAFAFLSNQVWGEFRQTSLSSASNVVVHQAQLR